MKIDVSKIEGYAEMTPEQKLAALESYEYEADNTETLKLKEALNKASHDVAEYKRQIKEKMSEQERLEAERQEKDAEKEALLKSLLKEKDVSKYQAEFLKNGFNSDLALKSAEALADGDYTTVFANLKTYTEELDQKIRADVLRNTPGPKGGNENNASVTLDQFKKMGYTERLEFRQKYPELYSEYTKR
ncbi:MAG: hypothetical protein MJ126_09105 [Lachnospiraceae bacterium]|nr:hypothetical protein [Lachnospiraceae bacterium]